MANKGISTRFLLVTHNESVAISVQLNMKTLPMKILHNFDQILSYEGRDDLKGNCLLKSEAVEPAVLSLEF